MTLLEKRLQRIKELQAQGKHDEAAHIISIIGEIAYINELSKMGLKLTKTQDPDLLVNILKGK